MASWDDDGYYETSFGVNKSRRYHAKLRDFYQSAYNYTVGFNAFAASGAFVAVIGWQPLIAVPLSGIVALASLFESIFKYENRARRHTELCVRFTRLAAEIETLPATPENLAYVKSQRLLIEAEEPDEKRLVELMASNEEARSRGVPESRLQPLTWWQCKLGYVFTFGIRRLEKRKAEREASNEAATHPPISC